MPKLKPTPLSPAQSAILERIRRSGPLGAKSHSDYWGPRDGTTLRALIRKGLVEHRVGVYGDFYRLTAADPAQP